MEEKVNNAIRECLQQCQGKDVQLVASKLLSRLRRDPAWTQEEVDQVSAGLVSLLKIK
jgi:hypothetical protein